MVNCCAGTESALYWTQQNWTFHTSANTTMVDSLLWQAAVRRKPVYQRWSFHAVGVRSVDNTEVQSQIDMARHQEDFHLTVCDLLAVWAAHLSIIPVINHRWRFFYISVRKSCLSKWFGAISVPCIYISYFWVSCLVMNIICHNCLQNSNLRSHVNTVL